MREEALDEVEHAFEDGEQSLSIESRLIHMIKVLVQKLVNTFVEVTIAM